MTNTSWRIDIGTLARWLTYFFVLAQSLGLIAISLSAVFGQLEGTLGVGSDNVVAGFWASQLTVMGFAILFALPLVRKQLRVLLFLLTMRLVTDILGIIFIYQYESPILNVFLLTLLFGIVATFNLISILILMFTRQKNG